MKKSKFLVTLQPKFACLHDCFMQLFLNLKEVLILKVCFSYLFAYTESSNCKSKIYRLAIQRLEVTKNDLQIRITKEVSKEKTYAYQTIIPCKLTWYHSRLEVMQSYRKVWKEENKHYMSVAWLWNRMYVIFHHYINLTASVYVPKIYQFSHLLCIVHCILFSCNQH